MTTTEAIATITDYLKAERRTRDLTNYMQILGERKMYVAHHEMREERNAQEQVELGLLRKLRTAGYCRYRTPYETLDNLLESFEPEYA